MNKTRSYDHKVEHSLRTANYNLGCLPYCRENTIKDLRKNDLESAACSRSGRLSHTGRTDPGFRLERFDPAVPPPLRKIPSCR
jgi:hypothetical protein